MLKVVFLLFFLFVCTIPAYAKNDFWDRPPHPHGSYGYDELLPDLLNIKGLTYHEARPILIMVGWEPLQTLEEGTESHEVATEYGEGKLFWEKGYHEVQTCTGAGMTYCSFLFQNKNGDQLRVVTKGEESEESSHFSEVAGFRFNP